ncbi:hypothetical protein A2U01_0071619, partial [Trifolium medium]|nr:hypothetical protein [Trifolium medium]
MVCFLLLGVPTAHHQLLSILAVITPARQWVWCGGSEGVGVV